MIKVKTFRAKYVTLKMAVSRLAAQLSHWVTISPVARPLINHQIVRYRRTKHWLPKWKKLRAAKVIKIDLPDFNEDPATFTKERERTEMKKQGLKPMRTWLERPFYIGSTGGVVEAYVPPEGDGKMSIVSKEGAKQKIELIGKKSKSMMAIRKLKTFEDDFTMAEFAKFAQDIYVKAHTYLCQKDLEPIKDLVTERCYPEMVYNVEYKTINWQFIKSLEPPRIVHARNVEVMSKDNIFSQLTVRFHTQQKLAVYDRFGRLMYGSEILAKDVLEYVVFEKHLSNVYGTWRIHSKIIPDWMPKREPGLNTFIKPDEPSQDEGISKAIVESEPETNVAETQPSDSKLATA